MNIYTATAEFSLPNTGEAISIGDTLSKYSDSVVVLIDSTEQTNKALYSWVGSADSLNYLTFSSSAPDPTSGGGTTFGGSVSLTSGETSVVVSAAFEFEPSAIVAIVAKPDGSGSNIFATIRQDTISATGFTVDFSSAIPGIGYKLNYIASA